MEKFVPPDATGEWPLEPWIRGQDREGELAFQEGEFVPLLLVDPARQMSDNERADLLDRVVVCINALAGIDDPCAFVEAAKRAGAAS